MTVLTREQVEKIVAHYERLLEKLCIYSDGVDASDLLKCDAALRAENERLTYRHQVIADTVGEENWSLRNQLADAQARCTQLEAALRTFARYVWDNEKKVCSPLSDDAKKWLVKYGDLLP